MDADGVARQINAIMRNQDTLVVYSTGRSSLQFDGIIYNITVHTAILLHTQQDIIHCEVLSAASVYSQVSSFDKLRPQLPPPPPPQNIYLGVPGMTQRQILFALSAKVLFLPVTIRSTSVPLRESCIALEAY